MYIAGAVRGMERGTLSEQRNPDGSERLAEMELLRLALHSPAAQPQPLPATECSGSAVKLRHCPATVIAHAAPGHSE